MRKHRQYERAPDIRTSLADPVEERQVLRKAAERDVLAVVRRRRRVALTLGERLHRAAECRPRFVERHVVARVDEIERCGEAGQAASDDGGPHQRPCPTMRSFVSAERCGGPSKTSKPRSSMRSSVARYRPANVDTQSALRESSERSSPSPSCRYARARSA